jgi:hypothetical protein
MKNVAYEKSRFLTYYEKRRYEKCRYEKRRYEKSRGALKRSYSLFDYMHRYKVSSPSTEFNILQKKMSIWEFHI